MNEPVPSIAIWIDPTTQQVKVDFRSQTLAPAEYGIVISSLLLHIARLFSESNPQSSVDEILAELQKGVAAGLMHRTDMVLPAKAH